MTVLTSLPLGVLHAVRDTASVVLVLAELGLELLCEEHDHTGALATLEAAA